MATEKDGIDIQIGTYRDRYFLYRTNASPELDYPYSIDLFGDLQGGESARYVLVPSGFVGYQVARWQLSLIHI